MSIRSYCYFYILSLTLTVLCAVCLNMFVVVCCLATARDKCSQYSCTHVSLVSSHQAIQIDVPREDQKIEANMSSLQHCQVNERWWVMYIIRLEKV